MPLVRSTGDIPAQVERETVQIEELGAGGNGETHRNLLGRPRTRLQSRREAEELGNVDTHVRRIVNESLSEFRIEIGNILADGLRNLSLTNSGQNIPGRPNFRTEDEGGDDHDMIPPNRRNNREHHGSNFVHGDFEGNSERILNIIRNWRIRFTGDISDFTVDEFIYRINTLTNANLKGNFNVLCEHAHILFEGKALKWFWRFHRSSSNMNWSDLCGALKRQYKDYYTDFDIKDEILRRKQKSNENFDEFYDAIIVLCDRLRTSISDFELCEIIQRNLRPEVRHGLLHVEITGVAQLRRAVRKHEKFVKDMAMISSNRRTNTKGQVSEVISDDNQKDVNDNGEEDFKVYLVTQTGKCWNCDKFGHSFVDCLEPRTIFCYGCGAKNMYKPQCPNCLQKWGNALRDVRLNKDGHPKQK